SRHALGRGSACMSGGDAGHLGARWCSKRQPTQRAVLGWDGCSARLGPKAATALTPLTWRGPPPRFHESLWGVLQKLSYLNALDLRDRQELLAMHPGTTGYLERLHSSIGLDTDPVQSWSLNSIEPIVAP